MDTKCLNTVTGGTLVRGKFLLDCRSLSCTKKGIKLAQLLDVPVEVGQKLGELETEIATAADLIDASVNSRRFLLI